MKLLIVGGVAGGASAAARARRLSEDAQIILFERGEHISFANCGLPYYIGGEIQERADLFVTTAEKMHDRFGIDVRTRAEVISIDRAAKQVEVRNHLTGDKYTESYDKLILSPGAAPVKPPLPGIEAESILVLRSVEDTDRIMNRIHAFNPSAAAIVGGGFIGLEMAENLTRRGIAVTVIEMIDQVMAPLDREMAAFIHNHLREHGVRLHLGEAVQSFNKTNGRTTIATSKGREIPADLVILSIGVKPESYLARLAGLELGPRGGIKVDEKLRTSDPDIFAVGDAVEVMDFITGEPALIPLAGPANKQGRIAADNALGRDSVFRGVQGTSVVKIFDLTAATTGKNEKALQKSETPYLASYTHSGSHAGYYPGSERMALKLLFAPNTGKILGAQAVGKKGVDKRIDVIASAIRAGMTVHDLTELELAYAPPFGSAKDPVNMAGFVAANIIAGDHKIVTYREVDQLDRTTHQLLDVRDADELETTPMIDGAVHIPLNDLRGRLDELDRTKTIVAYCAVGLRGYLAQRILEQRGFTALNLSGGIVTWSEMQKDSRAAAEG